MVKAKRGFVLISLVIVLGLGLLATRFSPISLHAGLPEATAIQIAWTHVDQGATRVFSAEVRRRFHTGFDIPVHDQAWVVTFTGEWHLLCDGSCDPTTEWVAIDYYTGVWIASQYSYQLRR
jgi:hypothetical protein